MKKTILTSYIPNSNINADFLNALDTMRLEEDAELIILECKPNYMKDLEEPFQMAIEEEIGQFIETDSFYVNENLYVTDFKQSINVIDPLSGLESLAANKGSLIVAFPRQRFKMVPRMIRECKLPRGIWCTGTISEPYYKNTKSGFRMRHFHQMGALIIESDDKTFNIRQLQWDGTGIQDLTNYYTKDYTEFGHEVTAISMGDDHAMFQDPMVMEKTEEIIGNLKPKYIVRHDTLDCCSISHHIQSKFISKALVGMTLEDEAKQTSDIIQDFENKFPFAKQIMVASNHPEFLDRYLDEARYKEDYVNHIIGLELAWAKAKGANVVDYLMRKYNKLEKVQFLNREDSYKICGIEVGDHGDYGSNGSRGNPKEKGLTYNGKVITGHSHSPMIGVYNNFVNGTSTFLTLGYTNDSGSSSWMNTHTLIYPNGKMTHIHILPEEVKDEENND